MELHDELLALSEELSSSANQAGIRRSISTAYYALFHKLIHDASLLFFPDPLDAPMRAATARAMAHDTMKQVAQGFCGMGTHKQIVKDLLADREPSSELKTLSKAFVRLQEARHQADYDAAVTFTQNDAVLRIKDAPGVSTFSCRCCRCHVAF
ncbi:MAG: hypothetical protein HYV27_05075 [Candidatus Hydrogenedentes bacterium]|nr:hypothetical protein [Candidatus Hydrogenedentota bacterium]